MRLTVVSGLALFAAVVLSVIASETAPVHPDRLGFEISISPAEIPADGHPQTKRQYAITAVVRQLETGNVVFAPKVYALEGVPASVTSDGEGGVHFKASFLVEGSAAKYTLEETRGHERLASNAGVIQLSR